MCRPCRALTLSLLLAGMTAPVSRAQQPAPAPTGSLLVTVVEQGTGAPVSDPDVAVRSLGAVRHVSLQQKTNAEGTVLFSDLAVGKYDAEVSSMSHRGSGDDNLTTVAITAGTTTSVSFSLGLNPVLRGQVVSPGGDPIPGATVSILTSRRRIKNRPVFVSVATATSGADGSFRVEEDLLPGEYYVRVEPSPKPAPRGSDRTDVALNPIYYRGETAAADATPVNLHSGDDVALAIVIPEVPTVTVRGRVVDSSDRPVGNAQITVRQLDGFLPATESAPIRTDESGVFTLASMATGLYAVHASVSNAETSMQPGSDGVLELDVGRTAIDDVRIEMRPSARLSGQFSLDGDVPETAEPVVMLIPEGPDAYLRTPLRAAVGPKRTFEINEIAGSYKLSVVLAPSAGVSAEGAYLEDGTDILHNAYNFAPGQTYTNARVLLSDRVAEITGKVLGDADALIGASVVMISEGIDADGQPTMLQAYVTKVTGGRFSVKGVQTGVAYIVGLVLRSASGRSGSTASASNDGFVATASVAEGVLRNEQDVTRIYVDGPGTYAVQLRAPARH